MVDVWLGQLECAGLLELWDVDAFWDRVVPQLYMRLGWICVC